MAQTTYTDPTAVFGRRVLAGILDLLLLAVPATMLATAQMEYFEYGSNSEAMDFCESFMDQQDGACVAVDGTAFFGESSEILLAFGGASLAIGVLNLVVLQGLTGFSVGKLLTGLRAVRPDGSACGLGKALVRWLLWLVDGQPCGIPLVGFITGLTTVGHRRVGDMVAKTFVVRRSATGRPILVPELTAPSGAGNPYVAAATAGGAWGPPVATPPPPPPGARWGDAPPAGSPEPDAEEPEPSSSGWATPEPSAEAPAAVPPVDAPPPQWDEARHTYIQWDPRQSAWLQWDETARVWSRIEGQ